MEKGYKMLGPSHNKVIAITHSTTAVVAYTGPVQEQPFE